MLYELAIHRDIQDRLRKELLTVESDNPSMERLNSLTFLDAVVRENLRINAVVNATIRVADKDDVIPLETPYIDSNGVLKTTIRFDQFNHFSASFDLCL
jgi:hypothetical protein